MIGSKQLIIEAQDFAMRGMSTSNETTDGAFSPTTDAINLTKLPGVIYHAASATDVDTDVTLSGNVIASSPDMNVTSPTNRLLVTDSGKYYSYNGVKLSAVLQTDASGNTYAQGFTDIITYAGEAYVTSKEKITRWQTPSTFNNSFFSFTNSNVPHPAIVYENNAYYADKNLLLQQTSAGGTPTTILTLSADQVIMSLGIDPGSGLMLISTTNALDISSTLTSTNKLLWYDGNSLKPSKSAFIDDVVLGFHTIGSTVLVGYGNNIGYVNGSGISWLKRLNNVTNDNTQLPYKHKMTHVGRTFYVLNGLQVLAYGEVFTGRKIWYPAYYNNVNSNKPSIVTSVGAGKLGVGFATSKFYTVDTTDVSSSNSIVLLTNKYTFPRPIILRQVYIEYVDGIVNNDNNRAFYYQSEDIGLGFNILAIQDITGGFTLKNLTGATIYFIKNIIGFLTEKPVYSVQFRYNASAANTGLKRFIVYYDPFE